MKGMNAMIKKFFDYFTRAHFYVDVVVMAVSIALLLMNFNSYSQVQLYGYVFMIVMCCHQLEEYRLPGGFVYGYNLVMGSDSPINYPGDRLSSGTCDIVSLVCWALLLWFHPTTSLIAFLGCFSIVEFCGHMYFGCFAYNKFKNNGKTTIYFPGNITAWFGFLPIGIASLYEIIGNHMMTGREWIVMFAIFVVFNLATVMLPQLAFKDKNSTYVLTPKNQLGYFEQYIK